MVEGGYPSQVGKHRITGILGQGGMGTVLSARDPDLDREVAIKLVDPRQLQTAEARSRFVREARALARLNELHIVQVFEFQPEGDQPFLVMERLRGRNLRVLLATEGPQPLERVLDCAWQVLRGLAAAHAAGVVHRDIKPTNLMLVDGGIYKILDFGLALSADEGDLTAAGEVVGTLRYMPPERIRGREAGAPGDLWSLGVTLMEMATGHRPDQVQVPVQLPGVPLALNNWLLGMTAADPGQRYATAGEALQALADAMPDALGNTRRLGLAGNVGRAEAPTRSMPPGRSPTSSQFGTSGPISSSLGSRGTRTSRPAPGSLSAGQTALEPGRVQLHQPRIPFVVKIIIAIWMVSSAATIATGWAITNLAANAQMARLRQELMGIAGDATLLIDPAVHLRLAAHPDPNDPGLLAMRASLQRLKALHPEIRNIYTMAQLPDTESTKIVEFICDASAERDENGNGMIDDDEKVADPGKRYPAGDAPELLAGFDAPSADSEVSRDQWGVWISGYAPIKDAAGHSVGLVGIDLPAAHIDALRSAFFRHSAALLAATLVAFLAAGTLVALRLRRPIAELHRGMLALANGDMDISVKIRSYDEFQSLADAFARMRDELKRAAAVRQAFDGFVTRALAGNAPPPSGDFPGAKLACQINLGSMAAIPLAERLTNAMPRLFALAQAQGGHPEQVDAGGVQIAFPATSPHDLPQERAVRVALVLLAELEHGGADLDLSIGITIAGATPAMNLARIGASRGLDLLISSEAFAPIRPGFYADRLENIPGLGELFVIKGAVSG